MRHIAKLIPTLGFLCLLVAGCGPDYVVVQTQGTPTTSALQVGVAAVSVSPCGTNPDYDGPITPSGVWGEQFTDTNGNSRWDTGERFVDDPINTQIDPGSARKYDGIFLAGFGSDRIAKGCHDDIW